MIDEKTPMLLCLAPQVRKNLKHDLPKLNIHLQDTPIRLYKLMDDELVNPYAKSRWASRKDWSIVLPVGQMYLILKKHLEENHFLCIDIAKFSSPLPKATGYYLDIPDVYGKIVSRAEQESCQSNSLECSDIERVLEEKQAWKPSESMNTHTKKWFVYLDMCKKFTEGRRFHFSVTDAVKRQDESIIDFSVALGNTPDLAKKIEDAEGQDVNYGLTIESSDAKVSERRGLGEIEEFDKENSRLSVKIGDESFEGIAPQVGQHFYAPTGESQSKIKFGWVSQETFYCDPEKEIPAFSCRAKFSPSGEWTVDIESVRLSKHLNIYNTIFANQHGGFYPPMDDSAQNKTATAYAKIKQGKVDLEEVFYYDRERQFPAFSCQAKCSPSGEWTVDRKTIEMKRLMLFLDFESEMYQIYIMYQGLEQMSYELLHKSEERGIWQVLSGERVSDSPNLKDIEWQEDCYLNEDQQEAVKKAVSATELCLIWGPPGTGKTEVIKEIVRQECIKGHKVLVTSQTNLAVDNVLERISGVNEAWPIRIAKIGYELKEEFLSKIPTLDSVSHFFAHRFHDQVKERLNGIWHKNGGDQWEGWEHANKISKNFTKNLWKFTGYTKKKFIDCEDVGDYKLRPSRQISQFRKLYLNRANVVGATLMGAGKTTINADECAKSNTLLSMLGISEFDTVIVDEASKALPTELFLPILLGKKVVLVGDHKQLPPMMELISSDPMHLEEWASRIDVPEEKIGVKTTLFETLWNRHKGIPNCGHVLKKQYRMHKDIQDIIKPFYQDKEDESVLECGKKEQEDHSAMLIADSGVLANTHAVWVNTSSGGSEELEKNSFYNSYEVDTVGRILESLPSTGDFTIGVITFYCAQMFRLEDTYTEKFSEKFPNNRLVFGTVDSFQGLQTDVVICSLVRSNPEGRVGFAKEVNRVNVAFSRARKLLCIVGDKETFCVRSASQKSGRIYATIYGKCRKLTPDQLG